MAIMEAQCPGSRSGPHDFKEQVELFPITHWRVFVCWSCQAIIKVSLKDKREAFFTQQNQPVREG